MQNEAETTNNWLIDDAISTLITLNAPVHRDNVWRILDLQGLADDISEDAIKARIAAYLEKTTTHEEAPNETH